MEDLGPGRCGGHGVVELDAALDLEDLRSDLLRRWIQVVELTIGSASLLLASLDQEPARRFGEHQDAHPVDQGERDLDDDGRLPRPVGVQGRGADANSGDTHQSRAQPDPIQGHEQAALLGRRTLDAVDGRHGGIDAEANTPDALAGNEGRVVARRALYARGPDDDNQAADLDGAASTQVVGDDAGEARANAQEDDIERAEGLLKGTELADPVGGAGVAEGAVVGCHGQHRAGVANVEVGHPARQGDPDDEEDHTGRDFGDCMMGSSEGRLAVLDGAIDGRIVFRGRHGCVMIEDNGGRSQRMRTRSRGLALREFHESKQVMVFSIITSRVDE